ncbi:MAG: flagellar hook-length control protein FliK [Telmatospirillum sp.]|nr:flagellar hook-length control protein FliK [Telmatospirillum sp.]
MEVTTLDQLIRSEPTAAANTRRANDQGNNPFSSLLDARNERPRVERNAASAKPANGPSMKTRKSDSDDAPEKPARADAKDRPAPKERAARDDKAHAADKAERPAAPESKRQVANADNVKEPAAKQDANSATDTAPDDTGADSNADADAQAAARAAADAAAAAAAPVATDPSLTETALPVAALPVAQTTDTPQPVAVAVVVAPQLETQNVSKPGTAEASASAALPVIAAPVAGDAKKLEAAAAAGAQEIAKPTSTLAEQQASADANSGEDYADFMLRNLAATPAVAATEKDVAKADPKAKETAWTVTIAPSAMATAPVAPTTALAVQAAADAEAANAIDANAPKTQAVAADDGDAKPAAKTAEGTAQFAQHLDPSRDVRAAEETRAPARPSAPPAHEQVAVHVRKAVAEGLDQITIRLNPAELGRIDVKIEVGNDGSLRAAFAADKQMTLDLLKGDSRQLEQALSEAGLSTDAGGLNFSLRGDNRENAQAFRQLGEEFARNRADDPAANEAPAPLAAGSYARRNAGPGRIDLNA